MKLRELKEKCKVADKEYYDALRATTITVGQVSDWLSEVIIETNSGHVFANYVENKMRVFALSQNKGI